MFECGVVEVVGEVWIVGIDVEGGDYVVLLEVVDVWVVGEWGEGGVDFCCF